LSQQVSSHSIQIAQICMQPTEKKEESQRTTEGTTTAYLTSIAKRYQDTKTILAQFVDSESGYCLECGIVHGFNGFTNIDEARERRRRHQQQNKTHKDLANLFWEAAP
jgi:hypothetical protein